VKEDYDKRFELRSMRIFFGKWGRHSRYY